MRIILCVTLIMKNISGSLSDTKSKGTAHISLGEGSGKNLGMFLLTER